MVRLRFQNVKFSYQNFHLPELNFDVLEDECLCVLGPSGCGKSSLLRLASGLLTPTRGTLIPAPGSQSPISVVFQEPRLLPWRTILENITLPLEFSSHKKSKKEDPTQDKAMEILSIVGLESSAGLFPHQLSGGMKMRVSLARALMNSPGILLLDEPLSALDESTRWQLQLELKALQQKFKMALVFITHSIDEAAMMADRVLIMSPGFQPEIQELNSPLVKQRSPESRFTQDFLEFMKVLHQMTKLPTAQLLRERSL